VPQEPNERFTITYSGSLYGLRNPDTLLAALNMLVQSGDIRPDEVLLRCVGRVGDDVKAKFEADDLHHSIEIIPYVPHKESVAYLLKSDALLLIVDDTKESNEIVPGKVYEYIGVGKPVIALAPAKSAIAELLEETRAGDVIAYGDVEACAKSLRTLIQRYRKGESLYSPNTTAIKSYERREAARTLASTLDQLCAKK
jgi:glycosyltransferase involved in cell wall biosynthesis